jgi:hypothetical protein
MLDITFRSPSTCRTRFPPILVSFTPNLICVFVMAYFRGGHKKLRFPSSHFVSLASPPLLHFSHSISSDSRSYHAKLHPRVHHGLFKKELQAIAVSGPSFHIENITSPPTTCHLCTRPNLVRFTSDWAPVFVTAYSRVDRNFWRSLGYRFVSGTSSPPPSSKSHSISPESYPFHVRLHTRIFHCLLKRVTQEIISPGLPFRVLQTTFPSNKSHSISLDSCPFQFQLHTGVHKGLGKRGTQEIAVPWLSSRV